MSLYWVHFCAHLTLLAHTLLSKFCPSVCLSNACIVTKRKHLAKKSSIMTNRKSPTSFPMSRRWTAYVAPKPPNSVTLQIFIRQMARFTYLWSNAHTTITCLLSDCLSHYGDVRCALAVRGSGPTCFDSHCTCRSDKQNCRSLYGALCISTWKVGLRLLALLLRSSTSYERDARLLIIVVVVAATICRKKRWMAGVPRCEISYEWADVIS